MITLFGIPNCQTVKKAMNFLKENALEFDFVDFKKTPPNEKNIKSWSKIFNGLPVNKSGLTYRKFKLDFENLKTEEEKIQFLIANPSMIKRPILEKNNKAIAIGFSITQYETLDL